MNTNPNCLFCKIVAGTVPSEKVYEDEQVLAFRDINPAAPVHILIIPKSHIDGADALCHEHSELAAKLILTATKIAFELQLTEGWRLVTNVLTHGGQTVRHLHIHLLGGAQLGDFGVVKEFRRRPCGNNLGDF
ncbi:MAG: histidine triad nucleotide-binding protein [Oscillospiraceae bacterium]|nr:histidine triad nucleotide-binding protein [Oscillospiraceae bacterium]